MADRRSAVNFRADFARVFFSRIVDPNRSFDHRSLVGSFEFNRLLFLFSDETQLAISRDTFICVLL